MWVSEITETMLNEELLDRLLFEGLQDPGEPVDCIVVLGSSKASVYRVPVAVEAYRAGRSERILLCGGKVRDFSGEEMTEAEHMYRKAVELGVPAEQIRREEHSQNTVENLLGALLELQRWLWLNRVRRILLVTTAYHMRRSLHLARYLFPAHITVDPCPAMDVTARRDGWMKTEKGINRVKSEAMNLVQCVRNGVFPDFEVPEYPAKPSEGEVK